MCVFMSHNFCTWFQRDSKIRFTYSQVFRKVHSEHVSSSQPKHFDNMATSVCKRILWHLDTRVIMLSKCFGRELATCSEWTFLNT